MQARQPDSGPGAIVSKLASILASGLQALHARIFPIRCLTNRFFNESVIFPSGRRILVQKLLAEGGFSFVYAAADARTGESFALKKVICQDSEAKTAAKAEVRVHEKFSHPNLLALVDKAFVAHHSLASCEICWFLFPLCSSSLREVITNEVLLCGAPSPKWTTQTILALMQGVCRGLQEMHSAGTSHRDVKPENVLLRQASPQWPFGTPVLMDFGSCGPAEVQVHGRRDAVRETESAAQFCTMQYRAPELFDVPSDTKWLSYMAADVWAVGCSTYCCLLGYSPFEVDFSRQPPYKPQQVDCSQLRVMGGIPWPRAGPGGEVPSRFKDLVCWTLKVDPDDRPTIREVLGRLLREAPGTSGGLDQEFV